MPNNLPSVFVFLNEKAGSSHTDNLKLMLSEAWGSALVGSAELKEGLDIAAAISKAKQQGAQIIAVAGGDGSVARVAEHLVSAQLPLLILPSGTANILARHLEIPLEAVDAAKLLHDFNILEMDAIQLGWKLVFSHLSMGLYANASHQASAQAKGIFRRLAYGWEVTKEVWNRHDWKFEILADDKEHSLRGSTVMVANVGDFGFADWQWAREVRAYDQVLDICIIHARVFSDYFKLAWDLIRLRHPHSARATHLKIKRSARIQASEPLPVRGDGDPAGELPIEIKVVPKALKVLVAKQY